MTRRAPGGRLRVVHLINHLGYGGTERQLFLLLKHFDRARFEHRVVVFNPSPEKVYDSALAGLGVEVHSLPGDCRGVARRLLHLTSRLRRWSPHVVHSWSVHDNPYAGFAGRWAGVPVRWGSLRGSLRSSGVRSQSWLRRRAMLRSVQVLVANSRQLVSELSAAGVADERIFFLANCVETEDDVPAADLTPLGLEGDQPVVGLVGNLRAVKNHSLFLRAMARVLPARPWSRGLLVGQAIASEAEYGDRVLAEIETLGLGEQIVLAGFRDDVPQLLRRMSVLCLTSHTEGMPNVVLEAMAAGTPVVAVGVGGVPELIEDGVHGFVVAPGDAEALARAVGRLLDDPSLARAMGRSGRKRAGEGFGCAAAARRLADAYLEALA